jgi:hypothetical protein
LNEILDAFQFGGPLSLFGIVELASFHLLAIPVAASPTLPDETTK